MASISSGGPAFAVTASGYGLAMDVDRIWTAAELEELSPNERDDLIRSGFVTDPDKVPAELLERARRKTDARIAAAGSDQPTR